MSFLSHIIMSRSVLPVLYTSFSPKRRKTKGKRKKERREAIFVHESQNTPSSLVKNARGSVISVSSLAITFGWPLSFFFDNCLSSLFSFFLLILILSLLFIYLFVILIPSFIPLSLSLYNPKLLLSSSPPVTNGLPILV